MHQRTTVTTVAYRSFSSELPVAINAVVGQSGPRLLPTAGVRLSAPEEPAEPPFEMTPEILHRPASSIPQPKTPLTEPAVVRRGSPLLLVLAALTVILPSVAYIVAHNQAVDALNGLKTDVIGVKGELKQTRDDLAGTRRDLQTELTNSQNNLAALRSAYGTSATKDDERLRAVESDRDDIETRLKSIEGKLQRTSNVRSLISVLTAANPKSAGVLKLLARLGRAVLFELGG